MILKGNSVLSYTTLYLHEMPVFLSKFLVRKFHFFPCGMGCGGTKCKTQIVTAMKQNYYSIPLWV